MSSQTTGPEQGVTYSIDSAEGYSAVLNDSASPNFCGALLGEEAISGLEGTEVRENITDLVEADGAVQALNWGKARTIVMKVTIVSTTPTDRNTKLTRLMRASNAIRSDATIKFTPSGSIPQQIKVRRGQRPQVSGGWLKTAMLSFTAADPRIYSQSSYASSGILSGTPGSLENQGTAESFPTLRITGPGTNPAVTANGFTVRFLTTLTAGQYIDVNTAPGLRTAVRSDAVSVYSTLDFPTNAFWWGLLPGLNSVSIAWLSGNTAASTLVVNWRDAWL